MLSWDKSFYKKVGVEETTEEKDGSSVVTVKETVDALPEVPVSVGKYYV